MPSSTTCVFVDSGAPGSANAFQEAMKQQNVYIRGQYRTYTQWSRVSTGRIEDVQMYVDAIPKALEMMQKA